MNPRWLKTLKEYIEALLVAVVLALIIRAFIVQAFKIPTGSMLETLQIGDQLLVSKFHYGVRLPFTDRVLIPVYEPARGDVIVFEYPYDAKLDANRPQLDGVDFVKRIVGLPGDVVEIRAKEVYVNGEHVTGEYIQHVREDVEENPLPEGHPAVTVDPAAYFDHCEDTTSVCRAKRDWMPPMTVPQGQFFVMGDNRDESFDSRFWGFVKREAIRGKAMIIYWSWTGPTEIRWERLGRLIH
ncbi:signal peptidase I Serine peptidase. MEROPS family S26A [Humidesulfovibrio mexicanus]|uniref:Signal peptidase I n=1 Tax=Humidesulfovibrio mexicanus TaxID=147047 RepID=A0A239BP94_9BACT|nr:signal peptidase I [Humidesulfovibrio mexicanus]SNS09907.1 signal peptidase I Serine peptidase. MEROPS family S26A [Humidesulfovibrio mexicanus]